MRTDPAFYRASGSPFEPRAVLVTIHNTYKELKAQHLQMYRQLDWGGLKVLVNKKP